MHYMLKGLITVTALLSAQLVFAETANSPVGYWKTIDDVTGKPKAIIEISESKDKTLIGQVRKIFVADNTGQTKRCTACDGENHNQPIVGMVVLQKLQKNKENPAQWENGTILDPKTGKIYQCNLQALRNDKLNVRGYIGLPLFGRTQTWIKVQNIA